MTRNKKKYFLIFSIVAIYLLTFGWLFKYNLKDVGEFLVDNFDNLIESRIFLVAKLDKNMYDEELDRNFSRLLKVGPNEYIKGIYFSEYTIKYVEKYKDGYLLYEIPFSVLKLRKLTTKYLDILVENKIIYSSDSFDVGNNYKKKLFDDLYNSKYGFTIVVGYKIGFVILSGILLLIPIVILVTYFILILNKKEKKFRKIETILRNLNLELNKVANEFKNEHVLNFVVQKTEYKKVNELQEILNVIFKEIKTILKDYEKTNEVLEEAMAELQETNAELLEKNLQIISALAEAVEIKDSVTGNHSRNVMKYSIELAKNFGISDPAELEAIRYGAILHDIGKIGIPEHILNKPGKLNDEEFEIMKKHTIFGERIIKAIPGWDLVADVVRHHHENYDGSGYPDGLKDGEISLRAQIVAIVDVFVALTEDRPYRKGLDVKQALEIMRKMVGVKFSKEVFEKFLEVLKNEGLI